MHNILDDLKGIFSEVLLCPPEELALDTPYVDMGVDSILAIQIAKLIRIKLGVNITTSELFGSNSIMALYDFITSKTPLNEEPHITSLETTNAYHSNDSDDDVVIVGLSGVFPDANSVDDLMENLYEKKISIKPVTRWQNQDNKQLSAGLIPNISGFDNKFFNISPKEASLMDPQHRLLLEKSFHALEDAGLSRNRLSKVKVGVITTTLPGDYKSLLHHHPDRYSTFSFLGNTTSAASGRISYFFNLLGSSLSVDTACSSSIVAIEIASSHLRNNTCDVVIVGAASIFSTPEMHALSEAANLISSSGRGRVFEEASDGFVPSEACCCIVITKRSVAKQLNMQVYGEVLHTEVMHNGRSNGIMSPSAKAQKTLLHNTFIKNNLDLRKIGYFEAHGTGTPVGDPIEINALAAFLRENASDIKWSLGGIKANIGHTLVASGLVSVIKALGIFKNNKTPPQSFSGPPNQEIKLNNLSFLTEQDDWHQGKEYIAVNSLGFTGTIAQTILKKPKNNSAMLRSSSKNLFFLFSAKSIVSFIKLLSVYKSFLSAQRGIDILNLSYSLNSCTSQHEYKCVIVASNIDELKNSIETAIRKSDQEAYNFDTDTQWIESIVSAAPEKIPPGKLSDFPIMFKLRSDIFLENDSYHLKEVHKISLPEYPFEHSDFWLDMNNSPSLENNNDLIQSEETVENIKNTIIKTLSESLNYPLSEINTEIPLQEFGIDSLIALQLLKPFKDMKVSSKIIFESTSISALAKEIHSFARGEHINATHKDKSKPDLESLLPSPTPIKSSLMSFEEYKINWIIIGGADYPPIFLLPPLNTLPHVWLQQVIFFTRHNYRVMIPYYPGHEQHNQTIPQSIEKLAEIVFYNICDLEPRSDLRNIVGWSLGGCIALQMAIKHPNMISKIVITNTASRFESDVFSESVALRNELHQHKVYLRKLYKKTNNSVVDYISTGAPLDLLKQYYDMLQEFNVANELPDIISDTLVFGGKVDAVIPLAETLMFKEIKKARVIIHPDEGHFIPLTNPFDFNSQTLNFIKGESNVNL